MRTLLAVLKKEIIIAFSSAIFYVVALIFLIICGIVFSVQISDFVMLSAQGSRELFQSSFVNITDQVIKPYLAAIAIVFIFMIPLITMRLYAEEKKNNTIELLFTYPISDTSVLNGKFLSALLMLLILLSGSLLPLLSLNFFCQLDWGIILIGYLGLILMGAAYISIGLFTSCLTENQIIAAITCFGILAFLFMISWAKVITGPFIGTAAEYLSSIDHFIPFMIGIFDTRHIIYYLLLLFFWLFLSLRLINSHHWRG